MNFEKMGEAQRLLADLEAKNRAVADQLRRLRASIGNQALEYVSTHPPTAPGWESARVAAHDHVRELYAQIPGIRDPDRPPRAAVNHGIQVHDATARSRAIDTWTRLTGLRRSRRSASTAPGPGTPPGP